MFISVPQTCFEPVVSLVLAHWFISFSLSWSPVLLSAFCFCGFQLCFTQARLQLFDPPVFLSTLRSSAFTKSMLPSCLSSTKNSLPCSRASCFQQPSLQPRRWMDTKSASRHRKICTDKITGRATGKSSSLSNFRKSVTRLADF